MKPLAHGAGIDCDALVAAYRRGFFPMADPHTGEISWYCPDPRAIIPLDAFNVPRSLRRILREHAFEIRVDTAFPQVIQGCAEREETWISGDIMRAYILLHNRGFAHSVESWRGGSLVGGLYGVSIGGAFFGESMFSKISDASKVTLVHLVERLRKKGYRLLDTQIMNEHVRQFGAIDIPRIHYLRLLAQAVEISTDFGDS